ncbi:MAG: hypothetical protein LBE35_09810, partial [Clostridiales bacterium]|nr:hypothetical protein [Clostridiales bacterium]
RGNDGAFAGAVSVNVGATALGRPDAGAKHRAYPWRAKRATILKPPLAKNQRTKNRPAPANVIPHLTRNPLLMVGDSRFRGNDGASAGAVSVNVGATALGRPGAGAKHRAYPWRREARNNTKTAIG